MHGNVCEWCADWVDWNYYQTPAAKKDPTGPNKGPGRIYRGGTWDGSARLCRSALRDGSEPDDSGENCGFRLVLVRDAQADDAQVDAAPELAYPNGDEPAATRQAGAIKTLEINGVKVNFHWAPAGPFQMGSPASEQERDDDEQLHKVTLSHGFWIAETETTQELWQAVMGDNPSKFSGDNQLPVDNLTWYECLDFVIKLNSSYDVALPNGYKFAMPTEAQWEYACRAGTTTPFNFGAALNGDQTNCQGKYSPYGTSTPGEALGKTAPVKSYKPNAWGLYDMHGNVWEWCADWYDARYYARSSSTIDPSGSMVGADSVLRGGSWNDVAKYCRSARREHNVAENRHEAFGFRLVLVKD